MLGLHKWHLCDAGLDKLSVTINCWWQSTSTHVPAAAREQLCMWKVLKILPCHFSSQCLSEVGCISEQFVKLLSCMTFPYITWWCKSDHRPPMAFPPQRIKFDWRWPKRHTWPASAFFFSPILLYPHAFLTYLSLLFECSDVFLVQSL